VLSDRPPTGVGGNSTLVVFRGESGIPVFIASREFLNAFPAISGSCPVPAEVERRARGDPEDQGDSPEAQARLPQHHDLVKIHGEAWPTDPALF